MSTIKTYHNAQSAGELLGLSGERVRQLWKSGELPISARLNGEKPLVDAATLLRFAAERAAAKAKR